MAAHSSSMAAACSLVGKTAKSTSTGSAASGIGREIRAGAAAAYLDQVVTSLNPSVRALDPSALNVQSLGPSVRALDHEPGVRDHFQVLAARLALAGQVVAEEDRVDDVQRKRLQRPEVNLPSPGQPHLRAWAHEAHHGQDRKPFLGIK